MVDVSASAETNRILSACIHSRLFVLRTYPDPLDINLFLLIVILLPRTPHADRCVEPFPVTLHRIRCEQLLFPSQRRRLPARLPAFIALVVFSVMSTVESRTVQPTPSTVFVFVLVLRSTDLGLLGIVFSRFRLCRQVKVKNAILLVHNDRGGTDAFEVGAVSRTVGVFDA